MNDTLIFTGETASTVVLDGEMGLYTKVREGDLPYYSGAVEITPSQDTQILQTAETILLNNITVNPIPSNYGLITWNGSTLTVS